MRDGMTPASSPFVKRPRVNPIEGKYYDYGWLPRRTGSLVGFWEPDGPVMPASSRLCIFRTALHNKNRMRYNDFRAEA